jgi:hypothetical protein
VKMFFLELMPCGVVGKVTDTNDGGRVLDASAHLLSRALVSQSAKRVGM